MMLVETLLHQSSMYIYLKNNSTFLLSWIVMIYVRVCNQRLTLNNIKKKHCSSKRETQNGKRDSYRLAKFPLGISGKKLEPTQYVVAEKPAAAATCRAAVIHESINCAN